MRAQLLFELAIAVFEFFDRAGQLADAALELLESHRKVALRIRLIFIALLRRRLASAACAIAATAAITAVAAAAHPARHTSRTRPAMPDPVRYGILGAANIARQFTRGVAGSSRAVAGSR